MHPDPTKREEAAAERVTEEMVEAAAQAMQAVAHMAEPELVESWEDCGPERREANRAYARIALRAALTAADQASEHHCEKLREALRILADEDNWTADAGMNEPPQKRMPLLYGHDQPWELARSALAEETPR